MNINSVIWLFIGSSIGFIFGGLCRTAKKADEGADGIYFKCSVIGHGECEGMCCWLCPVATECRKKYKCKGNPGDCDHAILQ